MLTNDHEGRVLIEGGSVCDGGWTDVEAGVVCRMLGHAGGHTLPLPSSSIGHLLAEVRCRGWETNIMLCEHTRYHNEDNINDYNDDHARLPGNQECPGGQGDAGVSCYDEPGHGGGDPGPVEDNVITDIRDIFQWLLPGQTKNGDQEMVEDGVISDIQDIFQWLGPGP